MSERELASGQVLGDYEIIESIGAGGMSHVYRARHLPTRQLVALKVLASHLASREKSRARFVQEAEAAARIDHPHVVTVREVGFFNGHHFLAMELLEGMDLAKYLRDSGPLSAHDTVAIALPLASALAAVHAAGLVHRDIKPSNIFLHRGSYGVVEPKLLDFGISKLDEALASTASGVTGSREIFGTPAYFSPESLNGTKSLGPKSDQYSLGVVLFECLVGRAPFAGQTLMQFAQALASNTCPSPSRYLADDGRDTQEIPPALDEGISRTLQPKAEARFESMVELGRALWPLTQEPMRALWAPQFGEDSYMPPIVGSTSTATGLLSYGLVLRSPTPQTVPLPAELVPPRPRRRLVAWFGSGCVVLLVVLWMLQRPAASGHSSRQATRTPAEPASETALKPVPVERSEPSVQSVRRALTGRAKLSVAARPGIAAVPEAIELGEAPSGDAVVNRGRSDDTAARRRAARKVSQHRLPQSEPPVVSAPAEDSAATSSQEVSRRRPPEPLEVEEGLAQGEPVPSPAAVEDANLKLLFGLPSEGNLRSLIAPKAPGVAGANGSPILD